MHIIHYKELKLKNIYFNALIYVNFKHPSYPHLLLPIPISSFLSPYPSSYPHLLLFYYLYLLYFSWSEFNSFNRTYYPFEMSCKMVRSLKQIFIPNTILNYSKNAQNSELSFLTRKALNMLIPFVSLSVWSQKNKKIDLSYELECILRTEFYMFPTALYNF